MICGATATGKTRLSLELAGTQDGVEIVSADSRQVYRGMDIGTDKVALEDRLRIPHHGLDLVDPDERFSVAAYQRAAVSALAEIAARGRLAILVGGTGLYLRAVARGVTFEHATSDPVVRAEIEQRLADEGLAVLAAELKERAPSMAAATDLANPRRVVRALERTHLEGDRLPPSPAGYPAPVRWLGLHQDPEVHRAAILHRAAAQFEGGLLDEARALAERFPVDTPAFSAFGYREAFEVLAGRHSMAEAIAETARRTWAYARRQRTWFRSEPGITWLEASNAHERAEAELQAFAAAM
ncbi:MAG: tRNA (adenosine(37)-N6)-dimethylallyltransferase MiaA [Chloroflexi bacterium]|nr:tRNA (adenosine(37)-N6)-dimethylallyltransferase MiaA [Chloroflexota bacterium]